LATVCLAFFLATLDTTIVNIAIPDLQQRLGASPDQALWVVNSYTLTLAVLHMTLADSATATATGRVPRRLVCFTVTSALCGAAQSPVQLIAMHALQGESAEGHRPSRSRTSSMRPHGRHRTVGGVEGWRQGADQIRDAAVLYMGLPPTGKFVTYNEIFIFRFTEGRISEIWGVVDIHSQMQQLGIIPA
jgi:hypothetical protein